MRAGELSLAAGMAPATQVKCPLWSVHGLGECEHVEAEPAPVKQKEGWGPCSTAHLYLAVLGALIVKVLFAAEAHSDAVSVTL